MVPRVASCKWKFVATGNVIYFPVSGKRLDNAHNHRECKKSSGRTTEVYALHRRLQSIQRDDGGRHYC
jgi:hypothetical protein